MSGEEPDLAFDQESLNLITNGLRSAMDELRTVGDATSAAIGGGFREMSLTAMEAGSRGVAEAFEGFCERWEWGVRALVQDASALAQRLGLAAGTLWEEERYWADTLAVTLNAALATGNPHATEEEVAAQGLGEILTPDGAEFGGESFREAGEEIAGTWEGVLSDRGPGTDEGPGADEGPEADPDPEAGQGSAPEGR
ncbi:hypothetical protein RM780_00835 [Streptomyces sp. DSM 44917]|uniref:Uncharacterized protein n=1 Tax=Streptomyces boetiae TaxID=3075541 RepID=A0ABU2L1S4_9ACTN|nr:hypothetical protein [Streptomyces sp. DSM 44917]MDT0305511.1 hypothetical protein [Streptomyces sp. DSM 44917]